MIVIESDILVNIVVAIFSMVVSSIVTWYFSKRRYSEARDPITEEDIRMEEVKNEFRDKILEAITMLAFFLLLLSPFILIILFS